MGEVMGDCGLIMQIINGQIKPEIGYHIQKDCQRRGYASETARKQDKGTVLLSWQLKGKCDILLSRWKMCRDKQERKVQAEYIILC